MIIVNHNNTNKEVKVFEFQGQFENIELFDGIYDTTKQQMRFQSFTLQGRKVPKEFTVFEKVNKEIRQVCQVKEVILFDRPPRYNLDNR